MINELYATAPLGFNVYALPLGSLEALLFHTRYPGTRGGSGSYVVRVGLLPLPRSSPATGLHPPLRGTITIPSKLAISWVPIGI